MVIGQRLRQRRHLFRQIIVITGLRSENGGLQSPLISQAMDAPLVFDLPMMNGEHFGDGQSRMAWPMVSGGIGRNT
jgi:hypothetical protein